MGKELESNTCLALFVYNIGRTQTSKEISSPQVFIKISFEGNVGFRLQCTRGQLHLPSKWLKIKGLCV